MRAVDTLLALERTLAFLATIFTFGTIWVSGRRLLRDRDARAWDVFGLAFLYFGAQGGFGARFYSLILNAQVGPILFFLVPYLYLRLTSYFVAPARTIERISLVAAIFIMGGFWFLAPVPAWLTGARLLYSAPVSFFAAWLLLRERNHSRGVTRRRLTFAATSAILIGLTPILAYLFPPSVPRGANDLYYFSRIASHLSTLTLFLAFATPRRFTLRWQRTEVMKYVFDTSHREAADRGQQASADLMRAAKAAAANSAAFVAIREDVTSDQLIIRAAAPASLAGLTLTSTPAAGPIHQTYLAGDPRAMTINQVDADVRQAFEAHGESVLVAPIFTSERRWGVVGVIQRRGSLFPDDDLRLLAELARFAGSILDHGQLVAEAQARERQASDLRLREVESRMALMLDNITDHAILIVDANGSIVNWPVGARTVFGYAEGDVVDKSAGPLYGMSEVDFVSTLKDVERLGTMTREDQCVRQNGTRFQASTHIRVIEPGPDNLQGFVVVTQDITEKRELEERLRQGQKMEALGRLAGGVAHDFNNLLTAILGYADWLGSELPPEDVARRQQVNEIQKAAERAAGLTRQLLAFSRQQVVQPDVLDIPHTNSDLLPMLRRVIGEHINIVEESVGTIAPVLADRGQWEQIIVNLAVNARDAMPTGGRLTIRTSMVTVTSAESPEGLAPGSWVRLDVTDTGVGMDAETQARIFEPFFTTKEFGRGTGLGLATVYGIVSQMGGTIQVDSSPGAGTTFSVYVPATDSLKVDAHDSRSAVAPRGSETILLVEDEVAVRQLLTQILRRHGYELIVAESPAAARAAVDAHDAAIDLVISDVVLPGGSGPELVQTLRADRPQLRALFISGYADGAFTKSGEIPSHAHFLQKPFTAIDLLIKVRQLLASRPS